MEHGLPPSRQEQRAPHGGEGWPRGRIAELRDRNSIGSGRVRSLRGCGERQRDLGGGARRGGVCPEGQQEDQRGSAHGGSVWESNPPEPPKGPPAGFENPEIRSG